MQVTQVVAGDLNGNNLHLSTDGGGVDPRFRSKISFKVGAGAIVVNWDGIDSIKGVGIVFGEVPNPYMQTVPRAEVWAPVMGLQALDLNLSNIRKWDVDASYVATNAAKVRHGVEPRRGPLSGSHWDIWQELIDLPNGEPL